MSKKSFGLDALLNSTPKENSTQEATKSRTPRVKEPVPSPQIGLKSGDTRATFILSEASLEKIKAIAYWERITIKDAIQAMADEYITRYEKKQGAPVQPIPKRK